MTDEGVWRVVFYRDEHGRSPVREFLESLDDDAQQSIAWAIEQLLARNVRAREPLVKHLENKLWELRRESKTNTYRVIYFFLTGRRIVLVHGFQKKTPKTPPQHLALARTRYAAFIKRVGSE